MKNTERLAEPLASLVAQTSFADAAVVIAPTAVRVQFGSAFVLLGTKGTAIIAIAPMFRLPPKSRVEEFWQTLLELNAKMGGVASFAKQEDGWIILHAGRPLKGLDGSELSALVTAVGRFADEFDDRLDLEFFGGKGRIAPSEG